MNKEEKRKTIEEESAEEKPSKAKRFKEWCKRHKKGIIGGVVLFIGAVATKLLLKSSDSDTDIFSVDNLKKLSYDELNLLHEDVRLNKELGDDRFDIIQRINNVLRDTPKTNEALCKKLTDAESDAKIPEAWNKYLTLNKPYEKTKRLYEDYYREPEFLEAQKAFDLFDELSLEKQHRYAKAHPEKFPIHREHGYNLYKKD